MAKEATPESVAKSILDLSTKPSSVPTDAEIDARLLVDILKSPLQDERLNNNTLLISGTRLQTTYGVDGEAVITALRALLSQTPPT